MGDDLRDKVHLLNKATISYEYLHTNSTTHEFIFGALAELVDNSRDATANSLHIDYDRTKHLLSVLDDGCGMSRNEAIRVLAFGHSLKKMEPNMIGKYGNGLKSGAMRLAKNFILFTKKGAILTCIMISRTFHEEYTLKEIFVPTPSFDEEGQPFIDDFDKGIAQHDYEMQLIYKYSPFKNHAEIMGQFARISSETGTLIILYDLRRVEAGEFELNFKNDACDICLTNYEEHREVEKNSLREYLSILYLRPRMKIYLRGKKVQTRRFCDYLMNEMKFNYIPKNLKACAKAEYEECRKQTKDAFEQLNMAKSELGAFTNELSIRKLNIADKTLRQRQRILNNAITDKQALVVHCEQREKEAKRAMSNPLPLTFYFGMNIHHRNRYGCMIYNNGRLIEMYEKVQCQKENHDLMMKCLGVIGIVDVPYSVLAPTHNKQGFENKREHLALLRAMNEHMEQYWSDIQIGTTPSTIKQYWKNFGYDRSDWSAEPSMMEDDVRKRYMKTGFSVQCDHCLKWRKIPFTQSLMQKIPETWKCPDNNDNLRNSCQYPEEQPKIKEGHMRRKIPERPRTMNGTGSLNVFKIKTEDDLHSAIDDELVPRRPATMASASRRPAVENKRLEAKRRLATMEARRSTHPLETKRPKVVKRAEPESESDDEEEEEEVNPRTRNSAGKPPSIKLNAVRKTNGSSPRKRPVRVESESEEEEEEEILPSRNKPKTKGDLRRQMEEAERLQPISSTTSSRTRSSSNTIPSASASSTSIPVPERSLSVIPSVSASSPANITAVPKNNIISNVVGALLKNKIKCAEYLRGADADTLEKLDIVTLIADAINEGKTSADLAKMKRIVNVFVKAGAKCALPFKDANDTQLLDIDIDQFVRNIREEWYLQPHRERENDRLQEVHMRKVYPSVAQLTDDLLVIMQWALPAFANHDQECDEESVYETLRDLAGNLRDHGVTDEEEAQDASQ